jgi:predicted RNA-binding protein with PIN domain
MRLLIDGHNLIGSNLFSDIHLSDEDDEAKLVARLKIWQSRAQGKITVIFDRGIPGGIDVKMGGAGVEVIFAANPTDADDLIRRRLRNAQKGLTLVTNDEALLHEAALYGVRSWRGEEFVKRLKPKVVDKPEAGTEEEVQLSKAEVDEWLAIFRAARPAGKRPRKRPPADSSNKPAGTSRQRDRNRGRSKGDGKRR